MDKKNTYLIVIVVIICIAIGCLSPFIASQNPDGLEKTVEEINNSQCNGSGGQHQHQYGKQDTNIQEKKVINAPFADYSINGLGKYGEILVLIIGTILVLIIGIGIGKLLQRKK